MLAKGCRFVADFDSFRYFPCSPQGGGKRFFKESSNRSSQSKVLSDLAAIPPQISGKLFGLGRCGLATRESFSKWGGNGNGLRAGKQKGIYLSGRMSSWRLAATICFVLAYGRMG